MAIPPKVRVGISLCVILALGLSACTAPGAGPTDRDASLIILYPGGDEWAIGPAWGAEVHFLTFLPFVAINERGEVEGRLAKSWQHSADYRTWRIQLRTDVRWHDGVPTTAHDVAFTVDLWKHPDVQDPSGLRIDSLVVHDDSTLTITFNHFGVFEMPCLPGCFSVFYPKHLLEGLDPAGYLTWDFWKQPVGNGPFRYVRHVPASLIELESNPDYFRGEPALQRLILKFGDEASAIPDLLAENIDAVNYAQNLVAQLQGDERFRFYRELWDDVGAHQAIFWNQRTVPFFRDVRVRRALTLAVDRVELRNAVDFWDQVPIADGVFTGDQFRQGEFPPALPFDPVEAARLLTEAGWVDPDGDGTRERDGVPFRFELITNPEWYPAAVFVQQQYADLGVRMEVNTLDPAVQRERLHTGAFEAGLGYTWAVPDSGRNTLPTFLGENSVIEYRNDRIPGLLERARSTMVPDTIDALYRELAGIIIDELPWTFLTLNVETYIAHRRVEGLSSPFRANPVWNAEHLSLEAEP
jgi:peptide/nickel transport system substrate-binding protein